MLGLVFVLVLSGELARAGTRASFPNDSSPFWSFDARHVAFVRETVAGPGPNHVYVTPAGHGAELRLGTGRPRGWQPHGDELLVERGGTTWLGTLDHVNGTAASWSPDGQRVAYRRGGALYVDDARGLAETRVAPWTAPQTWDVTGPVWSPGGTEIAYADGSSLKVARADGSGTRTLFTGANQSVNPSWSADGSRIAFERNNDPTWTVWFVNADGTNLRQMPGGNENDRFPQFSPLSDRVAFISDRLHIPGQASPYRFALYVTDGNGVRPAKVVDDVRPDGPARWSPTGAQLAVAAGQECGRWGIYAVGSQGGKPYRRSNLCRFEGGPGNDVVWGTPYLDYLRGFAGNDVLHGSNGKNRIEGNTGNDALFSGSGNDALFGGPGKDKLLAAAGDDLVEGGPGRDVLDAGAGNDIVEARDGFRDVIDCGPGRDIAEVDRPDVVRHCESVVRP